MTNLELRGGVSQDAAQAQVLNTLNWLKSRTGVYVTEQGSNSSGRWRRWSDGFLEQWFQVASTTYNSKTQKKVSIPKAFTTTTYLVDVTMFEANSVINECAFLVRSRSASSFSVTCHAYSGYTQTVALLVYAAGY